MQCNAGPLQSGPQGMPDFSGANAKPAYKEDIIDIITDIGRLPIM